MTRLRSAALLATMLLTATGCAALSAMLGNTVTTTPAVVSVLDAYAATARAIAPAASQPDLAVLAELLRKRDECTVAASAVLMPDAGAEQSATVRALEDSAAATRALLEMVRLLAGQDGGAPPPSVGL